MGFFAWVWVGLLQDLSLAEGLMPLVSCSDLTATLIMVLNSSSAIWNLGGLTYLQKKKKNEKCLTWRAKNLKETGGKKSFWGHVTAENEHGSCWQVGFWRCWSRCSPLDCRWNTDESSHHLYLEDFQNLEWLSTIWSNFAVDSSLHKRLDLVVCGGSLQPDDWHHWQALQE